MLSEAAIKCPPVLLDMTRGMPPVRTAIVSAGSQTVMASARAATDAGLIEPVFFGKEAVVRDHAAELEWDIADFTIVDATSEEAAAERAAEMAGGGGVSSLMKGDIHTDIFLRKLLDRHWGLRTTQRLTHIFHMTTPACARALLITDAAVNVKPDFETQKSIVINAVTLAHALGIQTPKAALLSATEVPSISIPSSMEMARLSDWAVDAIENARVFGPLAFDLAISPTAAKIKRVTSPVAGDADIIVVPDIVTGNALFKMMVYFIGACAAGIVLGAKVPIVLTSRADPPEARLASVALAAIAAARHRD